MKDFAVRFLNTKPVRYYASQMMAIAKPFIHKETRNSNGVLHSFDDAPCLVGVQSDFLLDDKKLMNEQFFKETYGGMVVTFKQFFVWAKNGAIHRDGDNPAIIVKRATMGYNEFFHYFSYDGKMINDFFSDQVPITIKTEVWYKNGRTHRIGAPASIESWGNRKTEHYHFFGKMYDLESYKKMMKKHAPEDEAVMFMMGH